MAKLTLDLHACFNRSDAIERELTLLVQAAVAKRIPLVEIIPGKGSGQLKKRVLRFLARPDIKALYDHIDKDHRNSGRLFVRFRHGMSPR